MSDHVLCAAIANYAFLLIAAAPQYGPELAATIEKGFNVSISEVMLTPAGQADVNNAMNAANDAYQDAITKTILGANS